MKHYFTTQKETIFKNVEVLIYVFDVEKDGVELEVENHIELIFFWEKQKDMNDYMTCIKNLGIYSKNAHIFILIHKMDKLKENVKEAVFDKKKRDIVNVSEGMSVKQVFGTSIWDETLYKVKILILF